MKTSAWMGLLALLPALGLACSRLEPEIHVRRADTERHHTEGRGRRGSGMTDSAGGPAVIPREGLFVTAVAYPDGYDWRRDTARGNVRGQVLLLRMREEAAPGAGAPAAFDTVLALEAGAGRAVSLDADRHQFAGGHLYTQCITEAGTVWRRDGQTVLISKEREYLRGIQIRGDSTLYTLSQRLDGTGGFVLRQGRKPVLTRESGRIHGSLGEPTFGRGGALFTDGGDVCFLYESKDGGWILVRDGKEEPVTLPAGITQLYDIRLHHGTVCVVCRWKKREPVLFVGSKKYDLSTTFLTPAQKSGFRLLCSDKGLRISGSLRLLWNGQLYTGLWSEKWLVRTTFGHCDWLDPEFFVRKENGRIVETGLDDRSYPLDGGTLMMPACALRTGPDLYLALTGPTIGDAPILWRNGASIPLPLNGFPTSVTLLY
jgi:hypothetical protein